MRFGGLLIAVLAFLTGCGETPTGRAQLALVPESVMTEMGQEAFVQMKQASPQTSSEEKSALVSCVAQSVIEAAARVYPAAQMPENWEVVVFDNDSPNAFALPGGKIGVNTGLLGVAETDDQLAAVVGHEVAHVLAAHGNERLTQQLGLKAAFFLVGLFSEGEVEQEQLLQALGLGAQLGIALPFSRAHEGEADVMGLKIMAAAGFEPRESVELWRNMAAQGAEQPVEFLSTHPAHETRMEQLGEHMDSAVALFQNAEPASCAG